ncbi:MAG: tetratricopeptide repeat protein [Alphaproteobacteria bacterium]
MRPSNRTILYALLLTGGVAGIGIYIAPSPKEIGLMQMNDRDFSEAFKSFSVLHAAGDNSINVASPLINLDIYYGDIDKAIEVLTQYLADHPHSAEGYKRLAELYKSSQRLDHYCAALEILQKLSPSTGNLRDLADTYDFLGRREEEMGALTRLISSKDYNPADEDYIKLATFLHVAGKSDEAVNVIRSYIKDRDYEVGANTASLAVHLLLEEGKIDKAEDIAARYAVRSGDVNAAIALASQFEERRQPDAAYDLLKPFAKDVGKSPELEQQIVNILLAQRKDDEAMAMLKGQYQSGTLPPLLAPALIDLAIAQKDFTLADDVLKKSDAAAMPEDALLRYANFAQQTKRQTLAQILRERLGPDYLRLAPLLDAVLMIGVNDTSDSLKTLRAVPAKYMVSSTERLTVASIYLSHGIGGEALAMIKSASLPDMLDILGPADLALFYLEAGQPEDGVRQLVAARDDGTLQMQATIDEALLLLDAGQGHMAEAAKKADAYGDKNSDLFADGHDIAQRYGHNDVATMFALRLYKIAPTLPNRLLVAEALVREGRFGEAQAYLKPPAEKDEGSRRLYLDAVADWVEKAGIKNLPDAQKKEAESFLLSSAQGMNLSASDRLGFADLFDDIGLFDQAEKIYIKAADAQPYGSHEVSELLGFLQDHPSPTGKDWVEGRARRAGSDEKASWLTVLNEMSDFQGVIIVAQGDWKSSPAIADQYIAALVEAHETQKLTEALTYAINEENALGRLKRLAEIANQEDIDAAAERGWRKAHQIDPQDAEATRQLGVAAYNANRYDEAEPLLATYLRTNNGDYSVNYAYGEILQSNDKAEEAKVYFERALQKLTESKELSQEESVDEVHLLLYTGKNQQAVSMAHKLIDQHPSDKDLQADFVEMLTDAGLYDEALRLLPH